MTFYPDTYQRVEAPNDYVKLTEGEHRFRILMEPIIGYETWDADKKPHRYKTYQEAVNGVSRDGKVKEFHAFIVWDYQTKMVRLLNVTQKSIQDWIYNQTLDEDWADPTKYDIVIKREGTGFDDTEYFCTAKLPKPLDLEARQAFLKVTISAGEYFSGGHPIVRDKETDSLPLRASEIGSKEMTQAEKEAEFMESLK